MIAIDANLLLYAYNDRTPLHSACKTWFEASLNGTEPVGIPFQSILAFLRIISLHHAHMKRRSIDDALKIVDSWLAMPNVRILGEQPSHWNVFRDLCRSGAASGNLTTDAHMAALAITHEATFYTLDSDFARFPGLRWKNPLAG